MTGKTEKSVQEQTDKFSIIQSDSAYPRSDILHHIHNFIKIEVSSAVLLGTLMGHTLAPILYACLLLKSMWILIIKQAGFYYKAASTKTHQTNF